MLSVERLMYAYITNAFAICCNFVSSKLMYQALELCLAIILLEKAKLC